MKEDDFPHSPFQLFSSSFVINDCTGSSGENKNISQAYAIGSTSSVACQTPIVKLKKTNQIERVDLAFPSVGPQWSMDRISPPLS